MAKSLYDYTPHNVEHDPMLAAIANHNALRDPSDECYSLEVLSDRMEPFLRHGDVVIVDARDRSMIDGVYVFDYVDGHSEVLRVTNRLDGTVFVHGDNKLYDLQVLTLDKARALCGGRVRATFKRV